MGDSHFVDPEIWYHSAELGKSNFIVRKIKSDYTKNKLEESLVKQSICNNKGGSLESESGWQEDEGNCTRKYLRFVSADNNKQTTK